MILLLTRRIIISDRIQNCDKRAKYYSLLHFLDPATKIDVRIVCFEITFDIGLENFDIAVNDLGLLSVR